MDTKYIIVDNFRCCPSISMLVVRNIASAISISLHSFDDSDLIASRISYKLCAGLLKPILFLSLQIIHARKQK